MSQPNTEEIDKSVYPDQDIRGLSLLDSDSEPDSLSDLEALDNSESSEYGSDDSLHMSDSISVYLEQMEPNDPKFLAFQAYLENPWSDVSDTQLDAPPSPQSEYSEAESLPSRYTITTDEENEEMSEN